MPTAEPSVLYFQYQDLLLSFCGVQILRQGTTRSPEFPAIYSPFSLWRISGKLLAVDHSAHAVCSRRAASVHTIQHREMGTLTLQVPTRPISPSAASGNPVAINSFIMRVSISSFLNVDTVKRISRASSSGTSHLQGKFAGEKLLMLSKPVLTF